MDFFKFFNVTFCDAAHAWQFGTQDPATPMMEGMIFFHNYLMSFLLLIGVFVLWFLWKTTYIYEAKFHKTPQIFTHSSALEIIWTIIPALVLVLIAVPSFTLLYSLDELMDSALTLKVIGHQWYWSYEYSDRGTLNGIEFDSYMVPTMELPYVGWGSFRLLEVDHRVILPIKTHIRVLVTSSDVLHSWAIPSFGLKVDACPGRLTQSSLFIKRAGVYYGQCSEICGVNHGFMPIVVRGVSANHFSIWMTRRILENLE